MGKGSSFAKASKVRVGTSMRRMPNYAPKRIRRKAKEEEKPSFWKLFLENLLEALDLW